MIRESYFKVRVLKEEHDGVKQWVGRATVTHRRGEETLPKDVSDLMVISVVTTKEATFVGPDRDDVSVAALGWAAENDQ